MKARYTGVEAAAERATALRRLQWLEHRMLHDDLTTTTFNHYQNEAARLRRVLGAS